MKEKFIQSTIILLIGGFLTKFLGMIIKITMARYLKTEGLSMYMLILPTFSLVINISQFGFPIAISKLISEENKDSKKLFFSILPIVGIINLLLMTLLISISPFISKVLLQNDEVEISIIAMAFVIPFTTISSICRSYFFGKEKMIPHVISNITEDIIRLIIIIIGLKYIIPFGFKYSVCFLILINIVSELSSTIILICFLPKNIHITKEDIKPNKNYIKDSLEICIPSTSSKILGNITYFFEPIILMNTLQKIGYPKELIMKEYGILSGYVIPLIILPSFFTLAISQSLLPIISKNYKNNNIIIVKRKIKQAIFLSLLITIPITIIIMIFPDLLLEFLYNTKEGITYTRILAPICILEYIEAPLSMSLIAIGKSKDAFISTLMGSITRTLLLWLLSHLKIGIYSLIISISINIIVTTLYLLKKTYNYLK